MTFEELNGVTKRYLSWENTRLGVFLANRRERVGSGSPGGSKVHRKVKLGTRLKRREAGDVGNWSKEFVELESVTPTVVFEIQSVKN